MQVVPACACAEVSEGESHTTRVVWCIRGQFYKWWNWQVTELFQKLEDQVIRAMSRPITVSPASC